MATKAKLTTVEQVLDDMDGATLHSAMALAFAEIEAAITNADNPFFKSKYADLNSVIGTIKPALVAHGLFFTQHCHPSEDGVIVETVLHHRGGESLSLGQLYLPANKRDPQGFGSAQTYARRYSLQTAFGVPAEDDDGNAASRAVSTSDPKPAPRNITQAQFEQLEALRVKARVPAETFCKRFDVDAVALLPADRFEEARDKLQRAIKEPA